MVSNKPVQVSIIYMMLKFSKAQFRMIIFTRNRSIYFATVKALNLNLFKYRKNISKTPTVSWWPMTAFRLAFMKFHVIGRPRLCYTHGTEKENNIVFYTHRRSVKMPLLNCASGVQRIKLPSQTQSCPNKTSFHSCWQPIGSHLRGWRCGLPCRYFV